MGDKQAPDATIPQNLSTELREMKARQGRRDPTPLHVHIPGPGVPHTCRRKFSTAGWQCAVWALRWSHAEKSTCKGKACPQESLNQGCFVRVAVGVLLAPVHPKWEPEGLPWVIGIWLACRLSLACLSVPRLSYMERARAARLQAEPGHTQTNHSRGTERSQGEHKPRHPR